MGRPDSYWARSARQDRFLFSLLGVLIAGLVFALGLNSCQRKTLSEPIRIGIVEGDVSQLLPLIAREQQYYTTYGCRTVEWQTKRNVADIFSALDAGLLDIGFAPVVDTLVHRCTAGSSIRIVAPISLHGFRIIVHQRHRYADIPTLSRGAVGMLLGGTLAPCLRDTFFAAEDVSSAPPPVQQEMVEYTSIEALRSELIAGTIIAAFVPEPEASILETDGELSTYMLSEKVRPEHIFSVCVVSRQMFEKRADAIDAVLMALFEASVYLERNSLQGAIFAAATFTSIDRDVLERSMQNFSFMANTSLLHEQWYTSCSAGCPKPAHGQFGDQSGNMNAFAVERFREARREYLARKQSYYSSLKRKSDGSTD